MADYIIAFDAYGQPYLAHALGSSKNHKYLRKEPDYYGPGKHLYLYTQKEVDAFYNEGRRKGKRNLFQRIQDRSRDKRGWDERSDYEEAKERRDSTKKESDSALTRHRQAINNMHTSMPAVNEVNRKEASNRDVWNKLRDYNEAERDYRSAEEAYEKTRLGKKEIRKKRAAERREQRKKEKLSAIRKKKEKPPYLSEEERRKLRNKRYLKRFLKSLTDARSLRLHVPGIK